jgi:threonine synthase
MPTPPGFHSSCPDCGELVDIEYDLSAVHLHESRNPYLRFRDLLPVADHRLLPRKAEFTPLIHASQLGESLGLPWLFLKNETALPTGTTKDRMAAVGLAYLYECGVREFCTSSTGNSSTAYGHAMAQFPDMRMTLLTAEHFCHRVQFDPSPRVTEFALRGATFVEAFREAGDFARRRGFVPERGFFNPGRREGLKMVWLEAAEQSPRPIDWYVQAVSSAMGVFGAYKAANELKHLGRIDRLPRLLCVQQETCSPMVAAWRDNSETIQPEHIVKHPTGIAAAILRGDPTYAYPHIRRIVMESRGGFEAVSEREIRDARRLVEDLEGVSPCFSASTAVAGLIRAARGGEIPAEDTVVINLTGSDRSAQERNARIHWLSRTPQGWEPEDPQDEEAHALWHGEGNTVR